MQSNRAYRTIWNELENLGQQMGQAFAEAFEVGREGLENTIYPLLDVVERSNELWIYVELPGMKKEDIGLQFENNAVIISGEIQRLSPEDSRYLRVERFYGRFKRTVKANYQVDVDRITAEYKEGVLVIQMPRHEMAKTRTVNINVS